MNLNLKYKEYTQIYLHTYCNGLIQVKILITTRQKLIPDERILQEMRRIGKEQTRLNDLVLEIELKPLQAREAKQLYERCVDEKVAYIDFISSSVLVYLTRLFFTEQDNIFLYYVIYTVLCFIRRVTKTESWRRLFYQKSS